MVGEGNGVEARASESSCWKMGEGRDREMGYVVESGVSEQLTVSRSREWVWSPWWAGGEGGRSAEWGDM